MKRPISIICVLFALLANHLPLSAQSGSSDTPGMYGVLNDGKITLYYDGEKANRSGTIFDKNWQESGSEGRKMMQKYESEITECVIDPSFANYKTNSLAYFFYGWNNLKSIKGLENMNTENVTDMYAMFGGCSNLMNLDFSGFNTENVTSMGWMFFLCSSLTTLDLSGFNTENVTDMSSMFYECSNLTSLDMSGFNTENVTYMSCMFNRCNSLTSLDVSGFKTDNVTSMDWMFLYCSNLKNLDVSCFSTENVTNMDGMFYGCSNLTNLDLSGFNTAKVTDMGFMFYCCFNLTTIYASDLWDMSNVTESEDMFMGCPNLVGGAGTTYDNYHINGEYARIDGGASNPGYFTYKEYSGIATPLSIGKKPSGVYNLGGAKVRSGKLG
ncbi:MAG: BspA family leucine-rich repeat surface protein, partial [Prevotella sp.]|nr:BspA family leucine-rich repeat surface protein [Prevotella sp.]